MHYRCPVDVEFTINFSENGDFLINLVQCRPLQVKGSGAHSLIIPEIPMEKILFRLYGGAMGGPVSIPLDLAAVIDTKGYLDLPYKAKYGVPAAVGLINKYAKSNNKNLMLIGPGRWGTSSAEMGVPVKFAQISNACAICECSFENRGLLPELSFGSHFFQDLVESGIFYGAIFEKDCSQGKKSIYRPDLLERAEDIYSSIPDALDNYKNIINVYDTTALGLKLVSDSSSGETVCFIE